VQRQGVALRSVAAPGRAWWTRIVACLFHLAFAIWSVSFGGNFYLEELIGHTFVRRQFVSVTGGMASAIELATAATTAAETATVEAAQTARKRANTEAAEVRTCAKRPAQTPGEAPLMRGRFA
jgi:hypothetical protein